MVAATAAAATDVATAASLTRLVGDLCKPERCENHLRLFSAVVVRLLNIFMGNDEAK
jgi:hypothetical protein